jgi:hypothetical protein
MMQHVSTGLWLCIMFLAEHKSISLQLPSRSHECFLEKNQASLPHMSAIYFHAVAEPEKKIS